MEFKLANRTIVQANDYAYLNVTVRRNGHSIMTALVLPMYCFSFLTALLFILPPASGERVGTAITLLLAISVTMISVKDLLPTELPGKEIFFQSFIQMTFMQTIIAFIETLIVLALYDLNVRHIKSLIKNANKRITYDVKHSKVPKPEEDQEEMKRTYWARRLAALIDVVFFVGNLVVSIYFIVSTDMQIKSAMPTWVKKAEDPSEDFPIQTGHGGMMEMMAP